MEEKPNTPAPVPESDKVTSRRSRKDEQGRDYQCGCGKRYLSYPALYTHIKTKHDGIQPQGTLKTGTAQITKRTKLKLEDETFRTIQSYFTDFESQVINQLGDPIRGHISVGSRIKKDGVSKEMYDQYLKLLKDQSDFKVTEHTSLDVALLVFLINMGDYVNDKIYDQFLLFARLARACYHEHGDEVHKAIFSKKDQGPFQIKEFNSHHVKYFPLVSDFFIRFYVPETDSKDAKEANLSLTEAITYDFCRWLLQNKLTHIQVKMTRKVQIDFKPPVNSKLKSTPGKIEQTNKENDEKEIKQQGSEEVSEGQAEGEDIEEDIDNEDKQPDGSKEIEQL